HVKANSLATLDPYVASWPESERNDFFSWSGTVVKGQKMAINIAENAFTLLYRKDLFEQKGLKPPKSWDDFIQTCKALTTPQQWGFGFAAARTGSYFHVVFAPLVWGAGGEVLDRDGRVAFNDAAGTKAVKLLYDLVHVHKCAPPEVLNYRHD